MTVLLGTESWSRTKFEVGPRETASRHSHFLAVDYFLGLVQRAIADRRNVRISLPNQGEVFLCSARRVYWANVHTPAFWSAPAVQFNVVETAENLTPQAVERVRPIEELLWCAAFHASQGRLVEGCGKYDVAGFRYWPNLSRLPATANAARICAVLVQQPTTIAIVRSMLRIEFEEVFQIYSAAYCAGFVETMNRKKSDLGMAQDHEDHATPVSANDTRQGILSLLRAKLARIGAEGLHGA